MTTRRRFEQRLARACGAGGAGPAPVWPSRRVMASRWTAVLLGLCIGLDALAQSGEPAAEDPAQALSSQIESGIEQRPLPEDRGSVDPFADGLVSRVADFLSHVPRLHIQAEITTEQLLASGHKIQLSRSADIILRRPDRLRVELSADRGTVRIFYDGETLSLHDLEQNNYAELDVPANFDDMVDTVEQRLGLTLPLVDLLVSDVYENFVQQVSSGTYVGLHYVAGQKYHHLLLSNDQIDYQIWIADGPYPLPRRIVATYPSTTGVLQYQADIMRWDFTPAVPDLVFEFDPPADGDRVELSAVRDTTQ